MIVLMLNRKQLQLVKSIIKASQIADTVICNMFAFHFSVSFISLQIFMIFFEQQFNMLISNVKLFNKCSIGEDLICWWKLGIKGVSFNCLQICKAKLEVPSSLTEVL